jgi:phage terminase large subunit
MQTTIEPDVRVMIDPHIFNDVYRPYLQEMARTQIFFGGSSSGKSVFVVGQRPVIDVMQGGRNYLICRAVGRTIRRSVFNQVERTIEEFGVRDLFDVNKSEMTITCVNGYQIFFAGLDDAEKIKSITPRIGALTDIVIEEATECSLSTIKQLYKRQRGGDESVPKRLVLLFNPILREHWIFSEYFAPIGWDEDDTEYRAPDDSLTILRTWFVHNRFLTEADKADLLGETDKYYSDVYTWGKFGVLGNVIFTNWRIEDLSEMRNQFTNIRVGLDFGFDPAPAAVIVSHYDKNRRTIYVYDELCDSGMSDEVLAKEALEMVGKTTITCDSAEKKSIAKLRSLGVDARPAKKGPDSVNFGIKWLQGSEKDEKIGRRTIIVDKSCVNTQNELRQYKWKEGPDGNPILRNGKPVPVDENNHLIDALRYAYENDMIGNMKINTKATVGNYLGAQQTTSRPRFGSTDDDTN